MNRNKVIPNARGTKMGAKKPKIKAEDWGKRYQDLLEIARLVSWCTNRDLPTEMQRVIARQAEAERERRGRSDPGSPPEYLESEDA
jgi:hypothetical protein